MAEARQEDCEIKCSTHRIPSRKNTDQIIENAAAGALDEEAGEESGCGKRWDPQYKRDDISIGSMVTAGKLEGPVNSPRGTAITANSSRAVK